MWNMDGDSGIKASTEDILCGSSLFDPPVDYPDISGHYE
jgi:hypothetical protein